MKHILTKALIASTLVLAGLQVSYASINIAPPATEQLTVFLTSFYGSGHKDIYAKLTDTDVSLISDPQYVGNTQNIANMKPTNAEMGAKTVKYTITGQGTLQGNKPSGTYNFKTTVNIYDADGTKLTSVPINIQGGLKYKNGILQTEVEQHFYASTGNSNCSIGGSLQSPHLIMQCEYRPND